MLLLIFKNRKTTPSSLSCKAQPAHDTSALSPEGKARLHTNSQYNMEAGTFLRQKEEEDVEWRPSVTGTAAN